MIRSKVYLRITFAIFLLSGSMGLQAQSTLEKRTDKYVAVENEKENLDVLQQWIKWNNPGSMLINYLIDESNTYYKARDIEIKNIDNNDEWLKRQKLVKNKLTNIIGEFPKKTPLNAKITGVIKKDGYRIEKLVYEAFAGSYVTGCIYIPDKVDGKVPGILNVMGHDQEGYKVKLYQVIIANLVKKGMIVLAIDPPGQGEHVQYFNPEINFSEVGYSVMEHCYFGNQGFLSGISPGKYFIWEAMRGIDYLLSRKDIDPARIGMTGFSGGGTITSYVSAIDDRIKVSVPCSWSTASRRQLETKGVQDAETVFIGGLKNGITFEDLLEVRAPKPTLMTFVSRDQYLALQGAREAYSEIKKAYSSYGKEENLQFSEDDSKHWMTLKIREDIYSFFMKHFGIKGNPEEKDPDILSDKELKELSVTGTGQISTSLGGNMIIDLNKKESQKLLKKLELSRKNIIPHLNTVLQQSKEISGYKTPPAGEGGPFINGRYKRQGYTVGKYAIMGEGGYVIPILLFLPDDNTHKHPAIVYVHSQGKITDAQPGGEIEKLTKKGFVVAAIDVLGIGETKNTATRPLAPGYNAILIGRSIVGIQAGDIVSVVNYVKTLKEVDSTKIGGVGVNEMCLPMIHAAAFEPSISNIILIGSPLSYRSIAMSRIFKIGVTPHPGADSHHPGEIDFSWGVANVLGGYDLPDLIGCIAPRKVAYRNIKNERLEPASEKLINEDFTFPRAVYSSRNIPGNFRIFADNEEPVRMANWGFDK